MQPTAAVTADEALAAIRDGRLIECDEIAFRTEIRPALLAAIETAVGAQQYPWRSQLVAEMRRLDRKFDIP